MGTKDDGGTNRNTWGGYSGQDQGSVQTADALSEVQRHELVRSMRVKVALTSILSRDDGYLRLIPDELGTVVHCKYKFTRGEFKGRYVYWRDRIDMLGIALEGLLSKLDEVDAGVRVPVPDKAYREE